MREKDAVREWDSVGGGDWDTEGVRDAEGGRLEEGDTVGVHVAVRVTEGLPVPDL